ncbi:MAG TPA: DUF6785 family protein [Armatimonadota bacterium]|nr:DUF6785 family protein [Armatimonadota bacterium]
MTLRSVLLGLLGAAFICGTSYFNDAVMHQTYMVGNNMPLAVYGALVLFLLLINPLLYFIGKRFSFSGRELAVVLVLTLSACCIPGSGLLRTFTTSLIMPYHIARTTPGWGDHKILERVPSRMFPAVNKQNEDKVLDGFVRGQGVSEEDNTSAKIPWWNVGQRIHATTKGLVDKLHVIPWGAWIPTLSFWIPLVLILWVGLLGLSMVVHRQWADHEQLPYPIANFANALLPEGKQALSEIFHNKLFWIGMIFVMIIHLNNYACIWFPQQLIKMPMTLNFTSLVPLFPTLVRGGGTTYVLNPTLYFTAIAFAYFLSTDVSLALGIGPIIWFTVVGILMSYGISVGGVMTHTPTIATFMTFGAYLGFLMVLIFIGRRFYKEIFQRALCLSRSISDKHAECVWGARLFLAAMLVFIASLCIFGKLDWIMAVVFTVFVVMNFLVISRILAETGAFFIQSNMYASAVLVGLFGGEGLGTSTLIILVMLTAVFLTDPREAFMPFMVNSFKLLDQKAVKIGKVSGFVVVALLLGIGIALPVSMYFQYSRGADRSDKWACEQVPSSGFNAVLSTEQKLEAQGKLEQASTVSALGHFANFSPDPKFMLALGAGLLLTLLFTVGRLRFTKWPIHPVMFLIWNTYPGYAFAFSFLIGWLVKVLATKYGGGKGYRTIKPLMFGLIAGEMTAGLIIIIIGAIYYLKTGQSPQSFRITPG